MPPALPKSQFKGESESQTKKESKPTELFTKDMAYLNRRSGMSHSEIMKLPHGLYLLYLKNHIIMELQETEAGREFLAKVERYKVKDADLSSLRSLTGFKQVKAGESK